MGSRGFSSPTSSAVSPSLFNVCFPLTLTSYFRVSVTSPAECWEPMMDGRARLCLEGFLPLRTGPRTIRREGAG